MPKQKIGLLSKAECLYTYRRRHGLSRVEMAAKYRISAFMYGCWERGEWNGPIPTQDIGRLMPREWCVLLRRRTKKSQQAIADELKCCRFWVVQMERGDVICNSLVAHWEKQGYASPR